MTNRAAIESVSSFVSAVFEINIVPPPLFFDFINHYTHYTVKLEAAIIAKGAGRLRELVKYKWLCHLRSKP